VALDETQRAVPSDSKSPCMDNGSRDARRNDEETVIA
jgi:hypothetical protein